eukprot:scaffold221_cov191-Chaetoceros_neogracile.AAC.6
MACDISSQKFIDGSSWGVVRDGGAAIQILGHGANVAHSCAITFVAEAGTAKATGYFRLYFPIDVQFNDEAETTSKLETLSSIATVEVSTASLNRNMTGSDAQIWDITSMRNIGDISMLIADASKVKGTGVSMKIKEIVKGSGNTLYLLRIPEMGYLHTCSEQTDVIPSSASAAELKIELDATEPDLLILKLNEAGSKANDGLARQHF